MPPDFLEFSDGRHIAYHCTTSQVHSGHCRSEEGGDNGESFIRIGGPNRGVVFLGGLASDMNGTKALALEKWCTDCNADFLRFDYTGHGQSSGKFEDGCISDWYRDAKDAITRLTVGPQILVGSSMGGWIALLLALRIPEVCAGIIGIAAAPDFTRDIEANLSDEQHLGLATKGSIVLPSDYSEAGLVITNRLLTDGRRNHVMDRDLKLSCPMTLLHGTNDTTVSVELAKALYKHVEAKDKSLKVTVDADHRFSTTDCLQQINRAIIDMFRVVDENKTLK